MKIAVCIKQVLDASVPLRVVNGAVQQGCRRPIAHLGAAEVAALEHALALRARAGGEITALSVGEHEAADALRFCAALGADRLVHVQRPDGFDPTAAARAIADAVGGKQLDILLCGTQSGDGGSGHFPAVLACALHWPLVTAVVALTLEPGAVLRLERRLERGNREIVRCALPAVLACETISDAYRFLPVRALRRAVRIPIETVASAVQVATSAELIALEPAKPRPKRVSGPDASAAPLDRLAHLLSGGVKPKQSNGVVQGSPEAVAAEIVRFLEEKGFVKT